MKRTSATTTIVTAIATAVLAACATAPQRSEQLEEARARVNALTQDPMANEAAGRDVETARTALDQADQASQRMKDPALFRIWRMWRTESRARSGLMHIAEARARQRSRRRRRSATKCCSMPARGMLRMRRWPRAPRRRPPPRNRLRRIRHVRMRSRRSRTSRTLQKEYSDLQAKQTDEAWSSRLATFCSIPVRRR